MPMASTLEYSKAFRVLFNNYVNGGRRGKTTERGKKRREEAGKIEGKIESA